MSGSGDLLDDGTEWVELSPYSLNTGRNSPRSRYGGAVMHPTDLSMLCSALEDHIKTSIAPLNTTVGTTTSENQKNMDFTPELCVGQFGEWPSRPNVSGACSLLLSTGPNSSDPCSTDLTPPNSLEESYVSKPECAQASEARPWRIRHSSFFQWRFVGWLLHNLPSLFRHFASFLLGAAAYNVYPPEEAGKTCTLRSRPTGITGRVSSLSRYLVLFTQQLSITPASQNFRGYCLLQYGVQSMLTAMAIYYLIFLMVYVPLCSLPCNLTSCCSPFHSLYHHVRCIYYLRLHAY
ncbi:hypothetical protein TSMEX_002618 [Taenia solium]|eukprot:TsM_000304300 transcript=TsM_000304300 gene=TsM_000304300